MVGSVKNMVVDLFFIWTTQLMVCVVRMRIRTVLFLQNIIKYIVTIQDTPLTENNIGVT